jgi:hypothetical protein
MNKRLAVYEFNPYDTIDKLHNIATVLVVILHEHFAGLLMNFRHPVRFAWRLHGDCMVIAW